MQRVCTSRDKTCSHYVKIKPSLNFYDGSTLPDFIFYFLGLQGYFSGYCSRDYYNQKLIRAWNSGVSAFTGEWSVHKADYNTLES